MLRPQALIFFFHFDQPNREENRALGLERRGKKTQREIKRERGGFAQGEEEENAYKFKPFFET